MTTPEEIEILNAVMYRCCFPSRAPWLSPDNRRQLNQILEREFLQERMNLPYIASDNSVRSRTMPTIEIYAAYRHLIGSRPTDAGDRDIIR